MVIRLDAKPTSAAATPAAVRQQKYPPTTVHVRESRDRVPPSDIAVAKTTHIASAVTGLSASAVEESSGSSVQSMLPRVTVSAERSKGVHQQQPAASGPLTSTPVAPTVKRQRFVKKAAGPRDVELKHASPSGSLSSGSSGKSTSRDNVSLERTVVQSFWDDKLKEDHSNAAVLASTTAKDPGHSAAQSDAGSDSDVVQSTSASTNVARSVANRIAMFEQLPSSSDSSLDASSTDLTSTSAGTGQVMRPSSEDSQQAAPAASIPAKGSKQRAPVVNPGPGRFKLNTSTDDITSASAKSAVSSASGNAGGPDGQSGWDEQVAVMKDEDQIVDSTRL